MSDPRFLRLNLFPAVAVISTPGQEQIVQDPTRSFVTDTEIIIYRDALGGPTPVYQAPLADFNGNSKIGYTAEADDGTVVQIVRSSGCGCGSLLRGLNPFPGVPHQASS